MNTTQNNSPPPPDNDRHNTTPLPVDDRHNGIVTVTGPASEDGQGPREPNELQNGVAREIAHLDDEQTEVLIDLLQTLRAEGIPLNAATAAGYIVGAKMALDSLARQAKQQAAAEEHRRHRDSLPEPQRIEYMVERLRKHLAYTAVFKGALMQRLLGETVAPAYLKRFGKHLDTVVEDSLKDFEGTTPEFQRKVFEHYRENVLPGIEAEEMAEEAIEDAHEKAHDELAQLMDGKTVEQVRAITKQLRSGS